ncbi:phage tail-collar fiber domain-containing protein [Desulfoluna spongiiphila]|uniref:phage tail-collar fiber domain-containing protein n=1 Tax=Desulfoluna spongiiphila TaxID=419481 RepID=UPI00125A63EF|nr:phage tail protein [Desulfoluna spongiiphila]VVS92177.1 phage tail fibre protein [Desulfoluna spongiiphila]
MSSAITALGQTRINQLRGEEKPLVIDRMVLALVPGLDPSQPVDRNQQMPDPAHVVHTHTIDDAHKGYVNPDQVVYSMILGSDVGDFSFNWIGTVEAVTGKMITVTTTPETPKRKTDLGTNTTGNNITRNVMMRFQDAQALTGVSVSAETWQFDYTTWMVARIEEHDGDGGAHQDIRDLLATHGHNISSVEGVVGAIADGAVIESGSNANGKYMRLKDGTQICTMSGAFQRAITSGPYNGFYTSPKIEMPYPANFVGDVSFSAQARGDFVSAITIAGEDITSSYSAKFFLVSANAINTSHYYVIRAMAIGRWKE